MKLYGHFRSSASYRVRIALKIKGIEVEHVPVDLFAASGEHHAPDYAAKNPLHLVPTLELDDGTLLHESLAIIEYLDTISDGPRLVPAPPLEAARVRAASYAIACDIHPLNNLRVMNYITGILGHSEEELKTWYAHWVRDGGLIGFQNMIDPTGPYCFGDRVTMADCCLIPQIFNGRRFDVSFDGLERLLEIDAACAKLRSFQEAHPSVQIDAA